MRTKFLQLLIPAVAAALCVNAQQGLHVQNFPFTNHYVFNKDSVYATVSNGDIKRVVLIDPNDKEWKYINTNDYADYVGPFVMKSATEGIMIYSSQNKVYKTTDGWQSVTEVPNAANGFGLFQIVTTDAGYVGYENKLRDLYFSPDGVTWTNVQGVASGGEHILRSHGNKVVHFRGFSYDAVSNDGGQTFDISKPLIPSYSGNALEFEMISEDTFVVVTDDNLYITHDGGTNWSTTLHPFIANSAVIKNALEINIVSTMGDHYYTNDGGANWQMKTAPDNNSIAGGFYIGNDLYVWPSYKSSDNGTTWTTFFPPAVHATDNWDVSFHDSKGMVGRSGGTVAISMDKGRSFNFETKVASSDIMAVKVLKNGDMMAGDRQGQVYYSTDGVTWDNRHSNIFNYNAIKFSTSASDDTIVVTRLGQPLVSTDHGATFNIVSVGGGSHVQSVKPNGDIIDVTAKLDGSFQPIGWEIFKVDVSGTKNSIETLMASDEVLVDIHMASDNIGYLLVYNSSTSENKIYKTTNGWTSGATAIATMQPVNAGTANYAGINKVTMQTFGTDTLLLVGNGNTYYHSSNDGGATWTKNDIADIGKYNQFPSLQKGHFFSPDQYIMTLNASGVYLNTKEPIPVVSVKNMAGGNSSKAQGLVVYPNPSSSSIKLDGLQVPAVNVRMYDVSGRLALIKDRHDVKTEINVRDLPEGVYIISAIDAEGQTITTRFLKQ